MRLSSTKKKLRTSTVDEVHDIVQRSTGLKESLQRVRTEIKEELDSGYQLSTFSLNNKLPLEILRDIFKHCIEVVEIPVISKGNAYTISHVCSTWRRIALDIPELWTGISMYLTDENKHRVQVARQWLSRAGTLPRSISIKKSTCEYDAADAWGNNIILNLVAHYPLRSLELLLPYKQLKQLKGLLDRSASTLQVLRLQCYPENAEMLPLLFCPTRTLSKLKILALEGKWDLQNLSAVGSWSMIVYLNINREIPAPQCFDLLQHCAQIEICRLCVHGTSAMPTVPDLVLLQIRYLIIHTGGITTKMLVEALTAPKLEHLSFRQAPSQPPSDIDTAELCQMIERCQGLKHLSFLNPGLTSEPLNSLTLLEKLPSLETVIIHDGVLGEDAINSISLGRVGPKLMIMIFHSRHDANEVLRMVEARQQNASLNSYQPLFNVSPFVGITFWCIPVDDSLKDEFISRKNALEANGDICINLRFDLVDLQ